jgi:hypothetical protein
MICAHKKRVDYLRYKIGHKPLESGVFEKEKKKPFSKLTNYVIKYMKIINQEFRDKYN